MRTISFHPIALLDSSHSTNAQFSHSCHRILTNFRFPWALNATNRTLLMAVRLALLICDTPNPHISEEHGDYLAIFTRYFRNSIPNKVIEFTIDGYDVVHKQEYPSDDSRYDAVVITGSGGILLVFAMDPYIFPFQLPLHMQIYHG